MELSYWMMWLLAAATVMMLEIFSGTVYLLMVVIGLLVASVAAYFGASITAQWLVAAIVTTVAVLVLRRTKWGKLNKTDAASDSNVNLDIGQVLHVTQWQDDGNQRFTSRVNYRGAMWDVELMAGSEAKVGRCVIRQVRGSQLIVVPE